MRKRVSRPHRFAAVENSAIDELSSILAVGMLTTLIRAKDGDDVTVESLSKQYTEGREALTKAMRLLVEAAYVVKLKIQRSASETVVNEDGDEEQKRGGSWYTTFTVDSVPFTIEDVAAMLAEIYAEGNVKSYRVEPERLNPSKQRPTNGIPSVGATCGNVLSEAAVLARKPENPGPRPADGFPTVGRPTVGQAAALNRKKTSSENSLYGGEADAKPSTGERESATPKNSNSKALHPDAEHVIAAYEEALGGKAVNGTRSKLLKAAGELLDAGRPLWWVADRARELPARGWTDLAVHAERSKVPFGQQGQEPRGATPMPDAWASQRGLLALDSRPGECNGDGGLCGRPTAPGNDLCPSCAAENARANA